MQEVGNIWMRPPSVVTKQWLDLMPAMSFTSPLSTPTKSINMNVRDRHFSCTPVAAAHSALLLRDTPASRAATPTSNASTSASHAATSASHATTSPAVAAAYHTTSAFRASFALRTALRATFASAYRATFALRAAFRATLSLHAAFRAPAFRSSSARRRASSAIRAFATFSH